MKATPENLMKLRESRDIFHDVNKPHREALKHYDVVSKRILAKLEKLGPEKKAYVMHDVYSAMVPYLSKPAGAELIEMLFHKSYEIAKQLWPKGVGGRPNAVEDLEDIPMLASASAKNLGYSPTAMLSMYMTRAHKAFKQHGGPAAHAWNQQYLKSANKLLQNISRQPMAVQRAIHNHVLHQIIGKNKTLKLNKPSDVDAFMRALKAAHDSIAKGVGHQHTLGPPPKVSGLGGINAAVAKPTLARRALGSPAPLIPLRPNAGVNTAGVPRPEAKAAERGALGMNPMPAPMRHPVPLSMAPGPATMPGAKELQGGMR
jgi:hypothetical protein